MAGDSRRLRTHLDTPGDSWDTPDGPETPGDSGTQRGAFREKLAGWSYRHFAKNDKEYVGFQRFRVRARRNFCASALFFQEISPAG